MIDRVKQFIQQHQLIPANTHHVFIAVSGGVDSRVLLDIMYNLRSDLEIEIAVVHFNHRVRGRNSLEDEYFVRDLANQYKLKFQLGRVAKTHELVSETFLRNQRLAFFEQLLDKNPKSLLATGHQFNDNIETVLMRLGRGTRMRGLLGIQPQRDRYIRPLLAEKRQDIEKYARAQQLDYRMDRTNQDTNILRNKIRHEIIPYLESNLNRNFSSNLSRVIEDLNAHFQNYEENVQKAVVLCCKRTKNGITIDRKRFLELSMTIKRGLLEYCISQVYPLNYMITDRSLQIWNSFFADAQPGKIFNFLSDGSALAERKYIFIGELPAKRKDKYQLSPGNPVIIDNKWSIHLTEIHREDVKFTADSYTEYIDGDLTGDQLLVRFWKKGDFFRPIGMKHHRKLSDFFIDLKFSIRMKHETPLLCSGENIIWIAGHRLDDRYKITAKTKRVFRLHLKKDGS